jgi:thiol-disulfide isomerase/thioredoxin
MRVAFAACLLCFVAVLAADAAEMRTWTDNSGKFAIEAELVASDAKQVTLRKPDGSEIKVPVAKLCQADRDFLADSMGGSDAATSGADDPLAIATVFYEDLRNEDRATAAGLLTAAGQKNFAAQKSALPKLPTPDAGERSLRIAKAEVEGDMAAVPVRVRAAGKYHKTKLHLKREADTWRVFAISAEVAGNEVTINFETEPRDPNEDPLLALVGQPIEISGLTLSGDQLDWQAYRGKVVLIDFWATWCPPCREEIPNIAANYQEFHDKGFEVVAISVDKDLKELATFVADEAPAWTVVADNHPKNKSSMAAKFGISGIPAFVLVDAEGKVAAVHCRGQRLRTEIAKLLGDGAGGGSAPPKR